MEHCKEHDIPFDEMGYCALGCSGWELMEKRIKELEQELKLRPPMPLEGEARSRLLQFLGVTSVDEAIQEVKRLRGALEKIINLKFGPFIDGRAKTLEIAQQALNETKEDWHFQQK